MNEQAVKDSYELFKTGGYAKSFDEFVPVSVIVYAKNNAKHLNRLIPLLEEQEYENYELIFINNASNDETFEVIKEFQANNSRIKIVNVKNNEAFWGNRKYALTLGIKSAKHEQLLFIDADCIPNSKKWIKEMSVHFSESKSIVLGYAAYESKKYSFLLGLLAKFCGKYGESKEKGAGTAIIM